MSIRIAAVVVLYNPTKEMLSNIDSYIHQVDRLYAVDNSDVKNLEFVKKVKALPNVIYIDNNGNKGIASALNIAAVEAINENYKWLLTMDQDSKITPSMLTEMLEYVQSEMVDKISMLSPFHANPYQLLADSIQKYTEVLAAMTSGCLLNLNNYIQIGPFDEEMFIDHVDHEYCLRSHQKGYNIIRVNNAVLQHNVGNLNQHTLFGKNFFSTNHSPIRSYYSFRNRIRLIKRYYKSFPGYCFHSSIRFLIDLGIIVLYEDKKIVKLKMMGIGIFDGVRGRYGKFND